VLSLWVSAWRAAWKEHFIRPRTTGLILEAMWVPDFCAADGVPDCWAVVLASALSPAVAFGSQTRSSDSRAKAADPGSAVFDQVLGVIVSKHADLLLTTNSVEDIVKKLLPGSGPFRYQETLPC
jgi:hypothetical protein